MKAKLFTLLLALTASIGTLFAWDYEYIEIDELWYNFDASHQTAEVIGLYTKLNTITIPESVTYNNITYSVTSIGEKAFYYCDYLKAVTIPSGVTSIAADAFAYTITSVTWNVKNCPTFSFDYRSKIEVLYLAKACRRFLHRYVNS